MVNRESVKGNQDIITVVELVLHTRMIYMYTCSYQHCLILTCYAWVHYNGRVMSGITNWRVFFYSSCTIYMYCYKGATPLEGRI